MAKVVRSDSGGVIGIKAKELVPGDVVEVAGEDSVAQCRIELWPLRNLCL